MLKYKVLTKDLKSPFKGFQFELGEEYVCPDFCGDTRIDCAPGFINTILAFFLTGVVYYIAMFGI